VKDGRPEAYEALVDRLLSSPHYGERMALDWLDAARFADTHGYHIDSGRDMTGWREWVIDSFNNNLPYNQFTIQQLAGDLLPHATEDQKIASGFCRNNMVNFEGGAIPEEYHTAYVIDRVNTVSTVWLGLTMGCCQCHDHKFDPITQKEYYQFFAFFNNVPENGLDGAHGNAVPFVRTPTRTQQERLGEIAQSIRKAEEELTGPSPQLDAQQVDWERQARAQADRVEWVTLAPSTLKSAGGAALAAQPDGSILVSGPNPDTDSYTVIATSELPGITAVRLEALPEEHLAGGGPGRSVNGNIVLTGVRLSVAPLDNPAVAKPTKFRAAWADFSQANFPVAQAIDGNPHAGWAIFPEVGKPHAAIFQLDQALGEGARQLILTLEFNSQFSKHQLGKFRVSVTSAKNPLTRDPLPSDIRQVLAIAPEHRTDAQVFALRKFYRTHVTSAMKPVSDRLVTLAKEKEETEAKARTTMVMVESATPHDTFVLLRGQYDKHGEKVTAGVPKSLPPLPAGAPANRLALAQWLVAPSHPLTARVAVNRYWQMFFGTGLVKTAEDFGSQGEEPSNPQLLDWLAC
jgi:hypothetical protein